MLTGKDKAWFTVYKLAKYAMESALISRKSNFGILTDDDFQALRYQYAYYRAHRSSEALNGPAILDAKVYWKDGWTDCTRAQNDDWSKQIRSRGIKAKKTLIEQYQDISDDY